jgi:hypothetical protein
MDEAGPVNGREAVGHSRGHRDELGNREGRPLVPGDGGDDLVERSRLRNAREDGEPLAAVLEEIDDRQDVRMLNLGLKTARAPEAVERVPHRQVRRPMLVPEQDPVPQAAMMGRVVSVAGTGLQATFDYVRADFRRQLLPQEPMRPLVHDDGWARSFP